jgi:hypothetical protein
MLNTMSRCADYFRNFQNGRRCHVNGQNAKKLKNTKMIIAGYSPNRYESNSRIYSYIFINKHWSEQSFPGLGLDLTVRTALGYLNWFPRIEVHYSNAIILSSRFLVSSANSHFPHMHCR